jgi:hypothetical protein
MVYGGEQARPEHSINFTNVKVIFMFHFCRVYIRTKQKTAVLLIAPARLPMDSHDSSQEVSAYHQLLLYTLSHADMAYFIHQHAVDAFALQTASEHIKPVTFTYALIGLYLFVEKGYSGRQVQIAHGQLAKNKVLLTPEVLPLQRGALRVADVLLAPAGDERDQAILRWCQSVWAAYQPYHEVIASYAHHQLGVQ